MGKTTNDTRNDILRANLKLAQDGISVISVLGTASTTSSVASSATVVTLQAANTSRISLKIVNDGSDILYIKEGTAATTSDYTWKVFANEMVIINDYSGIVTGIWDVATGSARVTETT